ncbi:P1 family peptidase [Candidatus Palauibacter sp.]|uniref:DmpA family aminopeptidase n=1 Tax=Candidatus Palauibacter sp. TaxID=3101350 RepID=UPI003AF2BB73
MFLLPRTGSTRRHAFALTLATFGTIAIGFVAPGRLAAQDPPRARDLGIPFPGEIGAWNAITDVAGVRVGHATIIEGEGELVVGEGPVRTGVTAVIPRTDGYEPVFAGWYSLNGNGEMTGTTWVEESGFLEGPVMITNTHSVGIVHAAVIEWSRDARANHPIAPGVWWSLPVVAETWDGRLNDINGFHVTKEHTFAAIESATSGPVTEGSVGGGTGMVCNSFKGGIGTSSRRVGDYTVGVLVQCNYGRRPELLIAGVPVGQELLDWTPPPGSGGSAGAGGAVDSVFDGLGSIIVVIATDAPLLPHQLKRLARRAPIGIGRMGGYGSNSSGDIFIAFSTANIQAWNRGENTTVEMMSNDAISPLLLATAQATEEAITNAMVAARTMVGRDGNMVPGLPRDEVQRILAAHNRLERP